MKNGKKLFVALALSTAFLTSCEKITSDEISTHNVKQPTTKINENSPKAHYLKLDFLNEDQGRISLKIKGESLYTTSDFNAVREALKSAGVENISPCLFQQCIEKVAEFRGELIEDYPKYTTKLLGKNPDAEPLL